MVVTEGRFRVIAATFAARASIWLYSVYSIGQGAGIVLGGDERWHGPTFRYIAQISHPTLIWGLFLASAGLVALVGSLIRNFTAKLLGLSLVVFWHLAFSTGAFAAAASDPSASTTGGPVYLVVALAVVVLTSISEKKEGSGATPDASSATPAPRA
jgi:hypothetical protein